MQLIEFEELIFGSIVCNYKKSKCTKLVWMLYIEMLFHCFIILSILSS